MVEKYKELPNNTIKVFSWHNKYSGCCDICDRGYFYIGCDELLSHGSTAQSTLWFKNYGCQNYDEIVNEYLAACKHYRIEIDDELEGERIL